MKRFLLAVLTPLIALPWPMTTSAAQSDRLDEESLCEQQPTHPACLAIFLQHCAQYPDDPACMSDDDDDDDHSS